jgi:PleD family two-component response regulator
MSTVALMSPRSASSAVQQLSREMAENHPLRILIAEDNKVNQKVISGMLQKMGYDSECVENGHQAVEAISRKVYDGKFFLL